MPRARHVYIGTDETFPSRKLISRSMPAFVRALLLLLTAHVRQWPLRTLLTILGVALGVSASVAVRTANVDVLRSFEQAVLTVVGPTTLEVSGGETGLDEQVIMQVRTIAGVTSASPVILQTAVRMRGEHVDQAVQVVGLDLLAESNTRGFHMSQPSTESQLMGMIQPQAVFLGAQLATEWNLSVDDQIDLLLGSRRLTCRVTGILRNGSDRPSSWERMAVMDIAAAQITFGMVGKLDRIDVVTDEQKTVDEVAQDLRAVLPPYLTVERPANRTRQVEQMVRAFRLNLTVLSWVGLLVGMFLIYNTMAFAVAQRRREIGIYRAIGMTQSRVAVLFLMEAGFFGLLGGIAGSTTGMVLAQELVALLSRTISDLYVPVGAGEGGLFQTGQFWSMMLEGIVIGCVMSMIGAVGPSLDASRTATVRALAPGDYEASQQLRVRMLANMGLSLLALAGLLSMLGPICGVPIMG